MDEIELKLIAGPNFEVAGLEKRLAALGSLTQTQSFDQEDTYLDTEAGELVALGLSARVRKKSGGPMVEVKPVPITAGLVMRRSELRAPVAKKGKPSRTLRKMLAKMLGVALEADVKPVLHLRTARVLHTVEVAESQIAVCLDTVGVFGGGPEEAGRFVEVEAELIRGDEAVLRRVRTALEDMDLAPSGMSKYARARGLVGLPPYTWSVEPPRFDLETDVAEVARAVCRRQLQLIRNYEPGARVGLDTEHLHKMRVAVRRLRTALRVFEASFEPSECRAMNRGFRWLSRRLGAVRDLDVWLLGLPRWRARFGPEPTGGWDGLAERLEFRRARARRVLLDALDSSRWAELSAAADEVFAPGQAQAGGALRGAAGPLLESRVRAFLEGVRVFSQTHRPEDAHRLRIVGKRMRYAVEFLRPALGAELRPWLKRLTAFQDQLGHLQDASEAGFFALRELADSREPATAFALGALRGAARLEAEQAEGQVETALDELDVVALAAALQAAVPSAAGPE